MRAHLRRRARSATPFILVGAALVAPSVADAGGPEPPDLVAGCGEWQVPPNPNPEAAEQAILADVAVVAPDDVWAVGRCRKIVQGQSDTFTLAMHWDGAAWDVVPTPSPAACGVCTHATLAAVGAAGPNEVWAAGGQRIQGPDGFLGTHVLVMRWDGTDWTVLDTPAVAGGSGDQVRGIEVIGPDDVWFVGDWVEPLSQPALAMRWDGSGFTMTPVPEFSNGGHGAEAVSAVSSDDVWMVGGGGDGDSSGVSNIWRWDGAEWAHVPGPTPGGQRLFDVAAIATDDVWAAGQYFDGETYRPLLIHWDGETWTQFDSPGGGLALAVLGPDDVISTGVGAVHWDGVAWTEQPAVVGVASPSMIGADAIGDCALWAVGRQDIGGDLLTLTVRLEPVAGPDAADVNGDGVVDVADLVAVILGWGACPAPPAPCPADADGDGEVDVDDLVAVILAWS